MAQVHSFLMHNTKTLHFHLIQEKLDEILAPNKFSEALSYHVHKKIKGCALKAYGLRA